MQPQNAAPRFALLVGVDDYARPKDPGKILLPLVAPGNDVPLIKKLLVEQYGFPDDSAHIVTLIGRQATRQAIKETFVSQLIENAQRYRKDATVVFYFSGHGSTTPDPSGDKPDGLAETIVAYDSRVEGGHDIVSHEIREWVDGLRKYTSNITLIFDSCYSGTAARALVRSRALPPNSNIQTATPRSPNLGAAAELNDVLIPRGTEYAFLSGSRSDELSNEGDLDTREGTKTYGFFTYYLVNVLRQDPALTYLEAAHAAESSVVRLAPSQHPQAEGDVNRQVFGGPANREDPYIRVKSKPNGSEFTIEAGKMEGLQAGALLAIYAPEAKKLSGEEYRLANASVKAVFDADSIAVLIDSPKAPITERSKVRVITPYGTLGDFPIFIEGLVRQANSSKDRTMLAKLAARLEPQKLIKRIKSERSTWKLGVRRGCEEIARACKESYYLVAADSNAPLLGAQAPIDDLDAAAAVLAEGITLRARQDNIRAIDNLISPIRGQLTASLIAVTLENDGYDHYKITGEAEVPPASLTSVRIGDAVRIRVTNQSDEDLSAVVIALGSSGSVGVSSISPVPTGERLPKKTGSWQTQPFHVSGPLGLETYKVIATTLRTVNFTVLEQPGVTRDISDSPLQWLLNEAADFRSRDPEGISGLTADSWTTARVDLLIKPKKITP